MLTAMHVPQQQKSVGPALVRVSALVPCVALALALSTIAGAQGPGPRIFSREWYAQFSGPYSRPVEPFRIVGNIYYVGAVNIASYLITTPQGHILIDSGMTEMHDGIASSVEKLGYRLEDVRILLASHAHFDHIEGHALMQRRTGAQVMAMIGDAEAFESGHDSSALGAIGWEPVRVTRRLKDGETVTLGGTTLRAIRAPGHTHGATIWRTTVEDAGRSYDVAFLTTTTPNPGVPLFDNPRHKNVVEETRNTFRKLKAEREPDIVLVGHPQAMFAATMDRMRKGERPHRLLNGAEAWTQQLAMAEADFERRVAQEQRGK
jgi:metallo-beta-lactamase class B